MNGNRHLSTRQQALLVSRDLPFVESLGCGLHLLHCEDCRVEAARYRACINQLKDDFDALPQGVDWNALSRDMTANIHLGLAAGAIVRPEEEEFESHPSPAWIWQTSAVCGALLLVLVSAWMLRQPANGTLANAPSGVTLALPQGDLHQAEFVRTVDFDGGERVRQVDDATGQVTITQVYAD